MPKLSIGSKDTTNFARCVIYLSEEGLDRPKSGLNLFRRIGCHPLYTHKEKTLHTKLKDTIELKSTRHGCLSFEPRYSKGVSLKLGIFHKQKGSIALELLGFSWAKRFQSSFQNGKLVVVMDTNNIVKNRLMTDGKENKQHYEGRLQLLLLPPMSLNAAILIDQKICSIFCWYHPLGRSPVASSGQFGLVACGDQWPIFKRYKFVTFVTQVVRRN